MVFNGDVRTSDVALEMYANLSLALLPLDTTTTLSLIYKHYHSITIVVGATPSCIMIYFACLGSDVSKLCLFLINLFFFPKSCLSITFLCELLFSLHLSWLTSLPRTTIPTRMIDCISLPTIIKKHNILYISTKYQYETSMKPLSMLYVVCFIINSDNHIVE